MSAGVRQPGEPVNGVYLGTPFTGRITRVRPHSVRKELVICRIHLDAPTLIPFLGKNAKRSTVSLSVGADGKCPHQPERTFVRRIDTGNTVAF